MNPSSNTASIRSRIYSSATNFPALFVYLFGFIGLGLAMWFYPNQTLAHLKQLEEWWRNGMASLKGGAISIDVMTLSLCLVPVYLEMSWHKGVWYAARFAVLVGALHGIYTAFGTSLGGGIIYFVEEVAEGAMWAKWLGSILSGALLVGGGYLVLRFFSDEVREESKKRESESFAALTAGFFSLKFFGLAHSCSNDALQSSVAGVPVILGQSWDAILVSLAIITLFPLMTAFSFGVIPVLVKLVFKKQLSPVRIAAIDRAGRRGAYYVFPWFGYWGMIAGLAIAVRPAIQVPEVFPLLLAVPFMLWRGDAWREDREEVQEASVFRSTRLVESS